MPLCDWHISERKSTLEGYKESTYKALSAYPHRQALIDGLVNSQIQTDRNFEGTGAASPNAMTPAQFLERHISTQGVTAENAEWVRQQVFMLLGYLDLEVSAAITAEIRPRCTVLYLELQAGDESEEDGSEGEEKKPADVMEE